MMPLHNDADFKRMLEATSHAVSLRMRRAASKWMVPKLRVTRLWVSVVRPVCKITPLFQAQNYVIPSHWTGFMHLQI